MIRFLLSIIAVLITIQGHAQPKKLSLIAYNLSSYQSQTERSTTSAITHSTSTSKNTEWLHPTFSVRWQGRKKHQHEIELTNLSLAKQDISTVTSNDTSGSTATTMGYKRVSTFVGFRYEYILGIEKLSSVRGKFLLGLGINPYYQRERNTPYVSSSYPSSSSFIGMKSFLIPRFTYRVSKRIFIDANIPICLFDAKLQQETLNNPTLSLQNQKSTVFNYNALPGFLSGRIGIGILL
jgi:hypothetical protein